MGTLHRLSVLLQHHKICSPVVKRRPLLPWEDEASDAHRAASSSKSSTVKKTQEIVSTSLTQYFIQPHSPRANLGVLERSSSSLFYSVADSQMGDSVSKHKHVYCCGAHYVSVVLQTSCKHECAVQFTLTVSLSPSEGDAIRSLMNTYLICLIHRAKCQLA